MAHAAQPPTGLEPRASNGSAFFPQEATAGLGLQVFQVAPAHVDYHNPTQVTGGSWMLT